jgi:hypothetical protein
MGRSANMQIPSWVLIVAAVLAAFPFGATLGVLAAVLIAGRDVGVLPALTIPPRFLWRLHLLLCRS